MNRNKPMTIMTSRLANSRVKARGTKAFDDAKDFELTSPAMKNSNSCYVYASGVIIPISR